MRMVRKEIVKKFPKEIRYSFEPEALEDFKPITHLFHQTKKSMNALILLSYTKGATTEEIVEKGLKHIESAYSWLLSRLIDRDDQWWHLITLTTQTMTFWGIIYAIRAPHRKDEAKRILDHHQITLDKSFSQTIQSYKRRFLK